MSESILTGKSKSGNTSRRTQIEQLLENTNRETTIQNIQIGKIELGHTNREKKERTQTNTNRQIQFGKQTIGKYTS